jgi:hypothetical protein
LPELTTRPVERLENAKYNGTDGLASLNDFLCNSEKYSLKYAFNNDRYYDPLLYYSGWNRTIRLENGIMVWEKGNISTIRPLRPTEVAPLLKKVWGILPVSSLCMAFILTLFYLKRYKQKDYFETVPPTSHNYPKPVIYSAALLPVIFCSGFILKQVYELLLVKEQKNPKTAILNYYNHLDFQRFEKAFHFFKPAPTYPLDQYLLEKSVNDGGLLPSYAKLDSIHVKEIRQTTDSAFVDVYTRWRTSVGYREKYEFMRLVLLGQKWYILPPAFVREIPEEQMRSYTYTLFKKMGKRVTSSFPTVKDDRVKKPFAAFKQANFIRKGNENFIAGEILNADDIPINIALKIVVRYGSNYTKDYYPANAIQYNLSPKASTFFQVSLDNSQLMDSLKVQSIDLYLETDVSERGYIHGGTTGYSVRSLSDSEVVVRTRIHNELTAEINIPGILIAEKDTDGNIWQSQLALHTHAARPGLSVEFEHRFKKIQHQAIMMKKFPISLFVNGQARQLSFFKKDEMADGKSGIAIIPHCFMSQEIYLQ